MEKHTKSELPPQPAFMFRDNGKHYREVGSKGTVYEGYYEALYTADGKRRVSEYYRTIRMMHCEELDGEIFYVEHPNGPDVILKYDARKERFVEKAFPSGLDGLVIHQKELKVKEEERALQVIESQRKLKKGASEREKIEHSDEVGWALGYIRGIDAEIAVLKKKINMKLWKRRFLGSTWRNEVWDLYVGVPKKDEYGYVEGSTKKMVMGYTTTDDLRKKYESRKGVLCSLEDAVSHVEVAHNPRKNRYQAAAE